MAAGEDDVLVAGSVTGNLFAMDRDFPCPRCRYAIWVQYAEIVAQSTALCPCIGRPVLRKPRLHDSAGNLGGRA